MGGGTGGSATIRGTVGTFSSAPRRPSEDEDRMSARLTEQGAMRRALELALQGPRAGVNPQVGCVLLSPEGDVLAEGRHDGAGTPHAEVAALTALTTRGELHAATDA